MTEHLATSLNVLARHGERLRADLRFDWPPMVQQAVYRLRMGVSEAALSTGRLPVLAAILGGASSGKSTLFNNLLGGHLASRIAAWGHTTLGPVMAVPERQRSVAEHLLSTALLLPGFRAVTAELDGDSTGQADAVAVVFHDIAELGDVFLFDMPDFTSQAARTEGDVSLSLLPWFDLIVVVVDHERWFDRQSFSDLRGLSIRFGQHRFVEFNRTREEELSAEDLARLQQQARRLGAEGMGILEFRRGRGFRLFPQGPLDLLRAFLQWPRPSRETPLLGYVSQAASRVLNQNAERTARLAELNTSLMAAAGWTVPSLRDCMTALMTPAERRQLEFVSRVLRIGDTRQWLAGRTQRIQVALRRIPVLGAVIGRPPLSDDEPEAGVTDRRAIATSFYRTAASRQTHEVQLAVRSSAFWEEVRAWTDAEPGERAFIFPEGAKSEVETAAEAFDGALRSWIDKVEAECRGAGPYLTGAVGASAVALAVLLIALPGSVALLTLATIKGTIGAALTQLATAAGAGAALGKPMGRLIAVIQEKLIGGPEFNRVQQAAGNFQVLLEVHGQRLVSAAISEASALVIAKDDPLYAALENLREQSEPST